jgi:hypothetical protein
MSPLYKHTRQGVAVRLHVPTMDTAIMITLTQSDLCVVDRSHRNEKMLVVLVGVTTNLRSAVLVSARSLYNLPHFP